MMTQYIENIQIPSGLLLKLSGVAAGGEIGQVLVKNSVRDGDTSWIFIQDEITMTQNDGRTISVIGQRTRDGNIKYDWVGTYEEWQQGSLAGTIKQNWWCYITDLGEEVYPESDPRISASTEYVDNKLDPLIADYDGFKNDTIDDLAILQEENADYSKRIVVIEQAVGELLDEINGEIV